jgi:DNA polymerase/3'-5' exonuclease PolX
MLNQTIAKILSEMADLLDIKGAAAKSTAFRKFNYQKAAKALDILDKDIALVYKESGIAGIKKTLGVGDKMAKKIEEYLKKKKIKDHEKLKEETAIQQIIAHYFQTKGLSLAELKQSAKKRRIVYSRFTKPAKQLLDLAGSIEKAKETMTKVAEWANSRGLDYSIETVFKKWLEMDRLKPKEIVKKPFYRGDPMIWSETKRKWYVIAPEGDWLEFAGKESEMEWRISR